jgi:hypothetical protein
MSVRKIKKSYISCVGYFKSYKNDKQLAFESILERNFFTMLEFDNNVQSYEEQPFQINYKINGKSTRYTPDAMVYYQDGSKKVFEVKYIDEINSDEDLRYKLSVVKDEIMQQKGLPFEVFTDKDIDNLYIKNCTFLYKFAFLPSNFEINSKIDKTLKTSKKEMVSISDLLDMLDTDKTKQLQYTPYIWHTIFNNTSLIDMSQKITMKSLIKTGANK